MKKYLVLLLVLGGAAALVWYKRTEFAALQERLAAPPPPPVVGVALARSEQWQPTLRATGSLTAVQGIEVTTEVPGVVEAIAFRSGQLVKPGTLLVRLDAAVDKAQLRALAADARLAEVQFDRARELLKRRTVPQSEFDAAKARLDAARAQVAAQRERIAKKRIRAPFAGLTGIRKVSLGQYLQPGTPIVALQALDPIYVDYTVPERYLGAVRVGETARVAVAAWPGETFTGRVIAIDPGIDPGIRSVRLRAELPNADHRLRPGMFAEVTTVRGEARPVVTVPRIAVTFNPYGAMVFVVDDSPEGPRVELRQVETGEIQGARIEITRGVRSGERVVTAGHLKLRNGIVVQIDESVDLEALSGELADRPLH